MYKIKAIAADDNRVAATAAEMIIKSTATELLNGILEQSRVLSSAHEPVAFCLARAMEINQFTIQVKVQQTLSWTIIGAYIVKMTSFCPSSCGRS